MTLLTNCNDSDYKITANDDISARRPRETTSTKSRGTLSTRTEVGRRLNRVPGSKPRQILDL